MAYEIEIPKEYFGVSPKNFLKKKIDLSYRDLLKHLKNKRITLNGKKIKGDEKFKKGDVLKVWLDEIRLRDEKKVLKKDGKDLGMKLIFENDDFLILNKLPDVVVQGSQDVSLSLSYHLNYLKEKNESSEEYFHVHRLDKDTSGVLVCSKNTVALRDLNKIFREKNIVKKYVCLCVGEFESKEGKVECLLDRAPQHSKEKVVVSKKSGKKSLSLYKVLSEYEYDNEIYSFVEVEIKTGFMHQIRVHMKSLGHPIVGDKMYGNSYVNRSFEKVLNRQFLHSKEISFEYKDEKYKFEADLINDLKNTLKIMKKI